MTQYATTLEEVLALRSENTELRSSLLTLFNAVIVYQFSPTGSVEAAHAARDLDDAVDASRRIIQQQGETT